MVKELILGVTFIELLIVISLMAMLGALSAPFYSRFIAQTHHDATIDFVVSAVRKAQENAMDGKSNATWGVCTSGNVIRVYSDSCTMPTVSEDYDIPGSVSVTGLGDVSFNRRGEPSSSVTVNVTSDLDAHSVNLNVAGGVDVN